MRAVGVVEFGGPEALQVVDVPDPPMRDGHVRIRVHAAAVSPTDTFVRNGARAEAQRAVGPPPYVPGMDAAGVLAEIGPGVETDLQVGDPVMAIVVPKGSRGGYSEQLVLPADSVVRAPAGASHAEASTLPMNGLTARLALDVLDLPAGSVLAVTGAAGAFGGYVVQLAKADGLTVIADASDADEALVRGLGADVVVGRGDGFAEAVRSHFPDGVDGAADGALLHQLLAPAVKDGGMVVTVRGYGETVDRGVEFRPVWVSEYSRAHDKLDRLRQQVEQGQVTLRVADEIPKERAAEAHRRLEAGGVRGRLVITF
ncbi:MAG TPA: NADP-dependent oxidoreductase [Acidimicrobiales bacterium]|nr:NADP-dependent oxidoreductase [Acidimicrobiales bacterium]